MALDRDWLARRASQVAERLGYKPWLREFSASRRGVTEPEFWAYYALARQRTRTLWAEKPRATEAEMRSFYAETEWFMLRQLWYHRHDSYHWILRHLEREGIDHFIEFGAGIAPVTAWLLRRLPTYNFTVIDVPGPALDFARWRFREAPNVHVMALKPEELGHERIGAPVDGIACLDVLEHVSEPLRLVQSLSGLLKPGGTLFTNFIATPGGDENLTVAQEQRPATIQWLNANLMPVRPLGLTTNEERGHYMERSA